VRVFVSAFEVREQKSKREQASREKPMHVPAEVRDAGEIKRWRCCPCPFRCCCCCCREEVAANGDDVDPLALLGHEELRTIHLEPNFVPTVRIIKVSRVNGISRGRA
jgi:hypothetical protein